MKISFNEIAAQFKPWDLVIEIDGKDYRVRETTLADRAKLISIAQRSALETVDPKLQQELVEFVEGLFEGEKPPVREWDDNRAAAIMQVIKSYKESLVKKNGELAARYTATMASGGAGSK